MQWPSSVAVRRHLSPQGEGLEGGEILIDLYRLADARHFPRKGKGRGKQGEARGKIGNGMALLFKSLNRKCSSPSSVAVRRHLPPGGKAISKAKINFWTIVLQSVTKRAMPAPGGKAMK